MATLVTRKKRKPERPNLSFTFPENDQKPEVPTWWTVLQGASPEHQKPAPSDRWESLRARFQPREMLLKNYSKVVPLPQEKNT
jgi:hypothetical protein